WHVAATYGDEARCGPLAETWVPTGPAVYRVTGTACGPRGARAFAAEARVTGPGRITRGDEELWVLWVDADYRGAVIGTPSGRSGRVLSRTPRVRPDLMEAARRVLQFNGYDPAGLRAICPPPSGRSGPAARHAPRHPAVAGRPQPLHRPLVVALVAVLAELR